MSQRSKGGENESEQTGRRRGKGNRKNFSGSFSGKKPCESMEMKGGRSPLVARLLVRGVGMECPGRPKIQGGGKALSLRRKQMLTA